MNFTRRRAAQIFGAPLFAPKPSRAQAAWPQKPVHLVVTFIAGGANDIIARLVGERLAEKFGQGFVVDNRAGAGGNVGVEFVTHQAPDGYTFLQLSNAAASNMSLYPGLPFDIRRDLTPVAGVYDVPFVFVVTPNFPATTLSEFIAYAKANPGKLSYGTGGTGTISHMAGELLKMMAGFDMVHVPYRGSPQALGDLVGGRIECAMDPLPSSLPFIRDGRMRALAITSAARSPMLPDTPAIGETLAGYAATSITGTAGPKGLPPEITAKLNAAINDVLAEDSIKQKFADYGATPLILSAAAFGKLMNDEVDKWAKVVTFANIKPE